MKRKEGITTDQRIKRDFRKLWFSPNYESGNDFLSAAENYYRSLSQSEKEILIRYLHNLSKPSVEFPGKKDLINDLVDRLS